MNKLKKEQHMGQESIWEGRDNFPRAESDENQLQQKDYIYLSDCH